MNQSNWSTEARSAEVRKCFDSCSPTRTRMPAQWKLGKTVKFLIFGGPLRHIKFPSELSKRTTIFFKLLSYRVYWVSGAPILQNRKTQARAPKEPSKILPPTLNFRKSLWKAKLLVIHFMVPFLFDIWKNITIFISSSGSKKSRSKIWYISLHIRVRYGLRPLFVKVRL